ncbi:unnamed protein product [Caenorhabditis auriculariae]|uniref:Uncharacterized protein n=1 Tax=Caenorhabditis auriculariae TaxID=2777116 RepID=A0A8S1HTX3_9PELO|nr:unnamed protein product [Caenorhabditis auriculariae]
MDLTTLKWILITVMVVISLIFGFLPIKVIHLLNSNSRLHRRSSLIISLLSCFAGGVFLSVCFLDMLPDALEAWESVKDLTGYNSDYPFVQLMCLGGFFFVYIFEELSALCFDDHHHDHGLKPEKAEEVRETRSRFATVGTIFNPNDTILQQRRVSEESVEYHGEGRLINSVVFVGAFLLHVTLECFAFGVQEDTVSVTALFFGIIIHKAIVMFSIGMKLTRNHPNRWYIVVILIVVIAAFNLMGGAAGILVENSSLSEKSKDISTAVLMSLSLGTFIYITFFEMLAPERQNHHSNIAQWCAAFLGFTIIAIIMIWSN